MADHKPVSVDKEQVERAEDMWDRFTVLMKYSVVSVCGVLALMGLAFIDW